MATTELNSQTAFGTQIGGLGGLTASGARLASAGISASNTVIGGTIGAYSGTDALDTGDSFRIETARINSAGSVRLMVSPTGMMVEQVDYQKTETSKFKEYNKENFKKMSKRPLVSEMLTGLSEVPKDEVNVRIRQHIDAI